MRLQRTQLWLEGASRVSREEESIRARLDRDVAGASQPAYVGSPLIWNLAPTDRGQSANSATARPLRTAQSLGRRLSALTASSFASSSRPRRHPSRPARSLSSYTSPSYLDTLPASAQNLIDGFPLTPAHPSAVSHARPFRASTSYQCACTTERVPGLSQSSSAPLRSAGQILSSPSLVLFSATTASRTHSPWLLPPATVHTLSTSSVPLLAHSPVPSRCHFSLPFPVPGLSPSACLPAAVTRCAHNLPVDYALNCFRPSARDRDPGRARLAPRLLSLSRQGSPPSLPCSICCRRPSVSQTQLPPLPDPPCVTLPLSHRS